MSIKINYSNKSDVKQAVNTILFVDEKFNITNLKKKFSTSEFLYINDLLKNSDFKKKILVFEVSSKKKIILISIKKNIKNSEIESLGAELYKIVNHGKNSEYKVDSDTVAGKHENFIGYLLHGLKLKSYEFKKYKTKKKSRIISINVSGSKIPSPKTKIFSFRGGNFLC